MPRNKFRHTVGRLLSLAGVEIGGNRPWDLRVHNEKLYARLLADGSLGLGESYMDGWWDCDRLDEFFHRILSVDLDSGVLGWSHYLRVLRAKLFNLQKPSRAFQIGKHHYDIGNKLYRLMLGDRMIYSCGLWDDTSTLDEAQELKLERVCRKLDLQRGMRVLDIGCGWGGTARFMAERYDVEVIGITVSEQQATFGRKLCAGLPVEIRMQDYRSLEPRAFDRILSLGMFEHVGYKNYKRYMRLVRRRLKKGGLFFLQTIGTNHGLPSADPWIERYIFPNSMLPSANRIYAAIEGQFVAEEWRNFGPDYDRTLMQWCRNFDDSWNLLKEDYGERFYRMWKYFLLSSAGSFRAGKLYLWQIVLAPHPQEMPAE